MEVQNLILLILAGLIGIFLFAGLLKIAIMGAQKFLEITFQFLGSLLIISAILFVGYMILNKDTIDEKIDQTIEEKSNSIWEQFAGSNSSEL